MSACCHSRVCGSNTECLTLNMSDPKSVKCSKPQAGNSTWEFLLLHRWNTNTSENKNSDKQAGHQKRNIKHIGLEKIKASEYLLFIGFFPLQMFPASLKTVEYLPAPLHVKNNIMNGISQCLNIFKLHSSAETQFHKLVWTRAVTLLNNFILFVMLTKIVFWLNERQALPSAMGFKQEPIFRTILQYSSMSKSKARG